MEQAYDKKQWYKIQEIAHRMKGGATYCGLVKMQMACDNLVRSQKEGHVKFIEQLYEQLCRVVNETKIAINDWLKDN